MEIFVDRNDWVAALQIAAGIVERKQTKPILANVLITVRNDGLLQLTATDQEMELCCELQAQVVKVGSGQVTIPTKKCLDICRSFPEGTQIKIKIDSGRASITAQRSRFTLSTLPAEEFPVFGGGKVHSTVHVPCEVLKMLIHKTSFAMADQDVRFYLNGLLLDIGKERITFVGADGHRMAVAGALVPDISDAAGNQVIIPRKAVLEIQRMIPQEGMAAVSLADNFLKITTDEFVFICRLIDGQFPDYRGILPAEGDLEFTVDRLTLKSALSRIAIISHEKYKGVRFQLEQGTLRLRANNPEQEEAFEELEIDYSGFAAEVGFSTAYVLDVLNVLSEESVRIMLTKGHTSATIQAADDTSAQFVVMPMRY